MQSVGRMCMDEMLLKARESTFFFGQLFFPEAFKQPPSPIIHGTILNLIDDDSKQKVAIAAPRDVAKTTYCRLFIMRNILFGLRRYVLCVSASENQAVEQSENIKTLMLSNEMINDLFPGWQSEKNFSKSEWVANTREGGVKVRPRGAGQEVRGANAGFDRPDLIVTDDFEKVKENLSDDQRKKKRIWFYSDLLKSVDFSNRMSKSIVVGTVTHQDALLQNLLDEPNWHSTRLEICDDQFNSNWPEKFPKERLKEEYEEEKRKGLLRSWYMERRNIITAGEDSLFRPEQFRYYTESEHELDKNGDLENVAFVDPARTSELRSDYSAAVGVGIDYKSHRIFVREVFMERCDPERLQQSVLDMAQRLKSRVVAVEVTGLELHIIQPFQNAIYRRGLPIHFEPLKARGDKDARIAQMSQYYSRGEVWHNPKGDVCQNLEQQLLMHPNSTYKDVADAFANLNHFLLEGNRWFSNRLPSCYDDPEAFEREMLAYSTPHDRQDFGEFLGVI